MIHPQLRLAAAKFALDLATVADLVDASHAALDYAMFADGLAVIAATPNLTMWEARPHFTAALRDLDHTFTSQDDALRYVRLGHFGPAAEGLASPIAEVGRYYTEVDLSLRWGPHEKLPARTNPSARDVLYHWDVRGYSWDVEQIQRGVTEPTESDREWETKAIALCREWCRECARLHLQPAWRSSDVLALASAIHAERAFDRLPILADALEEAGCDHPDLLGHCRYPCPHTDYCWLVDALLANGAT